MENLPETLVPIFGTLMIICVVVGPIWIGNYFKSKDRERIHQTLRLAYEKGQPVPPELIEAIQREGRMDPRTLREKDLRRAIVLIGIALGLAGIGAATSYSGGMDAFFGCLAGAAIPGFIGLGFLVLWFIKRKEPAV